VLTCFLKVSSCFRQFSILHVCVCFFRAALRAFSLACPAYYCFITLHILSFLANKRERERGCAINIDFNAKEITGQRAQSLTAKQKQVITKHEKHRLECNSKPAGLRSSQL